MGMFSPNDPIADLYSGSSDPLADLRGGGLSKSLAALWSANPNMAQQTINAANAAMYSQPISGNQRHFLKPPL